MPPADQNRGSKRPDQNRVNLNKGLPNTEDELRSLEELEKSTGAAGCVKPDALQEKKKPLGEFKSSIVNDLNASGHISTRNT